MKRRFQAKRAKYWKIHVIETTASILTKSGTTIETIKWSSWVVQIGMQQIQNGRRPPFWKNVKSPYLCNHSAYFDVIWQGDAYWPKFTSDWNLFVREARAGSFRGTRSLANIVARTRKYKQCRQESGRRINFFLNHRLVGDNSKCNTSCILTAEHQVCTKPLPLLRIAGLCVSTPELYCVKYRYILTCYWKFIYFFIFVKDLRLDLRLTVLSCPAGGVNWAFSLSWNWISTTELYILWSELRRRWPPPTTPALTTLLG